MLDDGVSAIRIIAVILRCSRRMTARSLIRASPNTTHLVMRIDKMKL